jgi:hypothetical protein
MRALGIEAENQGPYGSIQVHLPPLWQSPATKGIAVRTAVLIASLLLIAACASEQVDPLLIPPEANVEANSTG